MNGLEYRNQVARLSIIFQLKIQNDSLTLTYDAFESFLGNFVSPFDGFSLQFCNISQSSNIFRHTSFVRLDLNLHAFCAIH